MQNQAISGRFFALCVFFLASGLLFSQEDGKSLAAKYQVERGQALTSGVAARFPTLLLEKADGFASQGMLALKAGRLTQAAEFFRQARWQLPYQAPQVPAHVARILGNMRLRHANVVSAVAFSPDGRQLASAGWDGVVIIWDVANGHESLTYTGHGDKVRCLAFSPNGKQLASTGEKKEIRIWDPATGQNKLIVPANVTNISSLVFSLDGKYLFAGHELVPNQKIASLAVYDVAAGKLKRDLADSGPGVVSLALSADGSILCAGTSSGQLNLWHYPAVVMGTDSTPFASLPSSGGSAYTVAFSPDNRTLARVGADGVKLYNLAPVGATGLEPTPRRSLLGQSRFTCALFGKDSKTLFTADVDGMITLWNTDSGEPARTFKAQNGEINSLALNSQGNLLASAGKDFTVRLWDVDVVRQARDLVGHAGAVWTGVFSPDGQHIVSGGADHVLRVWDVATRQPIHVLKGHAAAVTVARFSPDGNTLASGAGDSLVKLWNAATGQLLRTLAGHTKTITGLVFADGGTRVVSSSADHTIKIWETASGTILHTLDQPAIVCALAVSPDGKQIAAGGVDQSIRLFDAKTGQQQQSWPAHDVAVTCLMYSPSGRLLASGGADKLVRVWQPALPAQKPVTLVGHTGPLSCLDFSPDSQQIISCGSDQTVRLWKLDNGGGKEAQIYRGHRDWVTSVNFSKDGNFAVSSGADGQIKIWEITSKEIPLLAEHTGAVGAIAVSPDGKVIATGASDKTIKIWDQQTGRELFTLRGHSKDVIALAFLPDSKTLISTGYDNTIRLWDARNGKPLPLAPGQKQAFTALGKRVNLVAPVPDGKKLLAWVQGDEHYTTISSFDLATGAEAFSINDRGRNILSVAFSADGRWGGTGARDGSVRIFDLEKKGELLPGGDWFLYDKGVGLGDLSFTPDGSMLVAGSDTGEVKICVVARKETLTTLKAHDSRVIACQVSPDGKRFATASLNNEVKLWDLPSGTELRVWKLGGVGQNSEHYIPIAFSPDNKQLVIGNANTTAFVLELP